MDIIIRPVGQGFIVSAVSNDTPAGRQQVAGLNELATLLGSLYAGTGTAPLVIVTKESLERLQVKLAENMAHTAVASTPEAAAETELAQDE